MEGAIAKMSEDEKTHIYDSLDKFKVILDCTHEIPEGVLYEPTYKCMVKVALRKLRCDHPLHVYCHEVQEFGALKLRFMKRECKEICGVKLQCGDTCKRKCHLMVDPHGIGPRYRSEGLPCKHQCKKHCERGHQCVGLCGQPCPSCEKCQQLVTSGSLEGMCDKKLAGCSHRCTLRAHNGLPCARCDVPVAVYREQCGDLSWTECHYFQKYPNNCFFFSKMSGARWLADH